MLFEKTRVNSLLISEAAERLKNVVLHTPLQRSFNYSDKFKANIFLKREDLQNVRSYKIRGAYNKMSQLTKYEQLSGVVCASAGNHAQGVALSCSLLNIKGDIFMPAPTPQQKVRQVEMFGKNWITIHLIGDTFDDAQEAALNFQLNNNAVFIHPFDDTDVIAGQGTVGLEILNDQNGPIDFLFVPVGGGGLAAGVSEYFKTYSPQTKIIGVEPLGAPSMITSLKNKKVTTLEEIEKFVDGAAVKRVGELTFNVCQKNLDDMITVDEGKVCSIILSLYNLDAIVVEPAGALTLAALDQYADKIEGKNVVCVISGSNNDITRMEEIKERSLRYEGLKHYFLVKFPQRAGALKKFVNEILGATDDITYFEYYKKQNRERGPAIVGIEIKDKSSLAPLIMRMKNERFYGEYLNDNPDLLKIII